MAVFVVGMHRSGTSMVAAVLDALGVKFGAAEELLPANQGNLAGYFENRRVLEINDRLAAANNLNWRTLPAITARKKIEGIEQYLTEAEDVAATLEGDPVWGVKDPRLSFFLPYWKSIAPSSSVIICVRRPEAVALSLNVRNDLSFAYGAALWELYTLAALKNSRRMPRVALVYEQLLEDPLTAVKKIIAAVPELTEIDFSEQALSAAAARIKSDLDHSDEQDLDPGFLTDKQLKLYDRLAAGTLAVSRKDEEAPVSFELARLEAGHQSAKAAASRANEEIASLRAKLDSERAQKDAFLTRVKDLAQTFSGEKPIDASAEGVVSTLRNALRRLGELPAGYIPSSAIEEVNKLKDKQIGWFQAELESAGNRARSGLDRLQEALLEGVTLKAKISESERMRLLAEGGLKQLQADLESVRRECAHKDMHLEEAKEREAASQEELRNLNRIHNEMRAAMLAAQLEASELGKKLADKERDLASVTHHNEAVSTSLTALKEAHTSALQERDRLRTERNAFAAEREQLISDVAAERSRLERQLKSASEEVENVRKEMQQIKQTSTSSQTHSQSEKALATTRIALENATELVASLETEIAELKAREASRSEAGHSGDGAGGRPGESMQKDGNSPAELTAIIERLRTERDALQKGLAEARKAQAAAEATGGTRKAIPPSSEHSVSSAMRDRLARQLAAMQELVAAIDVLLAPKVGGRFWIPVRKIRVKLVQLRQILDTEAVRARRPS